MIINVSKMTFEEEMKLHNRVFCSATVNNDPRKKKLQEEYLKEIRAKSHYDLSKLNKY